MDGDPRVNRLRPLGLCASRGRRGASPGSPGLEGPVPGSVNTAPTRCPAGRGWILTQEVQSSRAGDGFVSPCCCALRCWLAWHSGAMPLPRVRHGSTWKRVGGTPSQTSPQPWRAPAAVTMARSSSGLGCSRSPHRLERIRTPRHPLGVRRGTGLRAVVLPRAAGVRRGTGLRSAGFHRSPRRPAAVRRNPGRPSAPTAKTCSAFVSWEREPTAEGSRCTSSPVSSSAMDASII